MGYTIDYIRVSGRKVGIVGLADVFKGVRDSGETDPGQLQDRLIAFVRQSNYIPQSSEAAYGDALYRAYRRFLGEDVPNDEESLEIRVYGGD
jgi:hypothetical protein